MILILVNNLQLHNASLQPLIELWGVAQEIVPLTTLDAAVKAVPSTGNCVIVMDSLFSSDLAENKQIVMDCVQAVRQKNRECKMILFANFTHDLPTHFFDYFIDGADNELLRQKLRLCA